MSTPHEGRQRASELRAEELERLEDLLFDCGRVDSGSVDEGGTAEMPERFEDLPAWQEVSSDLSVDLRAELPVLTAPRALDLRLAAALALPQLAEPEFGSSSKTRRRLPIYAAALAAGLLALLYLGFDSDADSRTGISVAAHDARRLSPTLILVDVDRPHTLFADPSTLSAFVGGAKLDAGSSMFAAPVVDPANRRPGGDGR